MAGGDCPPGLEFLSASRRSTAIASFTKVETTGLSSAYETRRSNANVRTVSADDLSERRSNTWAETMLSVPSDHWVTLPMPGIELPRPRHARALI
mgnify:CR=1 FL=1